MSKIFTIGLLFLVCISSACKKSEEQIQSDREYKAKQDAENSKYRQGNFSNGEYITYRFDPVSETCVAIHGEGWNGGTYSWPVPCARVKDKLDPSVRQQVEAMLKKLPVECR